VCVVTRHDGGSRVGFGGVHALECAGAGEAAGPGDAGKCEGALSDLIRVCYVHCQCCRWQIDCRNLIVSDIDGGGVRVEC
jgi:hypothetical protein